MVNVLIVSKTFMPASFMKDIEGVDPSVRVKNATSLYIQEMRSEEHPAAYDRLAREVRIDAVEGGVNLEPGDTLDSLLAEAEVIFAHYWLPRNMASRAPKLRWVYYAGVSIAHILDHDIFDGRVTVTNAAGAVASPIGESVIYFILMLAKNAPRHFRQKAERVWDRFENMEVAGKTAGIIGMGAIGTEVARRSKCMGLRVIATRRSATARETNAGCVDEVYPRRDLLQMLGESDFVVLALPLTQESTNLISERELKAMKPTAYIVNVSRGPIIDEPALIRALKEGWIAGAGLDVVAEEPMPADNELWGLPNVIITPHMAAHTEKRHEWVSRQFCDNLRRYLRGEKLINVVTREKGY